MQRYIGDRAGQTENQHQAALPDQPFAHPPLGADQRTIQPLPLPLRKEGEHPAVSNVALQFEINRQNQPHREREQRARPVLDRKQNIGRAAAQRALDPICQVTRVDAAGEGQPPQLVEQHRQALWRLLRKVVQVAHHRRHRQKAERRDPAHHNQQQNQDG